MIQLARWATIAFALFSLALGALEITGVVRSAGLGITGSPGAHNAFAIETVMAGSAADRAGLRPGETITFLDPVTSAPKPPGTVERLRRGDGSIVGIALATVPLTPMELVQFIPAMVICLLGLVIALRAWSERRARRLAWAFLWIVLEFSSQYTTRWRGLDIALDVLDALLVPFGMAALVLLAADWPRVPSAFVRAMRAAAIAIAVVYALCGLVATGFDALYRSGPAFVAAMLSASWALLALLAIVALIVSFTRALGADRQRIGWMLATFAVALGPLVVFEPLHALNPALMWPWVWYTATALPFGLGYATLRHRVIDLGFALNRAAVFAATTLLIAGLFGGFQWTVNQLLAAETKREGFIAQLAVAVVVLYVVGFARTRTERFIANVFFGKRHRRIDAILRIAEAVDFVDDPRALAPLVIERLHTDAGIEAALVFSDAPFTEAASDDVAVFPLRVRARNRGTLSCVSPEAGETFAPDERAALTRLAMNVGIAHALLSEEGAIEPARATAAASAE